MAYCKCPEYTELHEKYGYNSVMLANRTLKELRLLLNLQVKKATYKEAHEAYWKYQDERSKHRPKCFGEYNREKKRCKEDCRHWSACWPISPSFHYARTVCDRPLEIRRLRHRRNYS